MRTGNVLSTPQILALDNQEATIEVGDKVVVSANNTVGIDWRANANTRIWKTLRSN